MAHFIGNKGKSSAFTGKNSLTPNPSPEGEGSSLAVLQFLAIARGEWAVQAERSPFRVGRVFAEERYCLGCCGVRCFDVVEGQRLAISGQFLAICRCCGKECHDEGK